MFPCKQLRLVGFFATNNDRAAEIVSSIDPLSGEGVFINYFISATVPLSDLKVFMTNVRLIVKENKLRAKVML